MKCLLKLLSLLLLANLCLSELFCPQTKEPPQEIQIDSSHTVNTISFSEVEYKTIKIANKIFLDKNIEGINSAANTENDDSKFCPEDFIIPKKEDYESIITQFGADAYSTFTAKEGFNMEANKYYLTNTKGKDSANKYFMYLEGTNIKFIDADPSKVNSVCRCMLDLERINLVFPNGAIELNQNVETSIQTSKGEYANGFLWKIGDKTYTSKEITHKFEKSGMYMVEFWGKYINGETLYLCQNVFVKKEPITNSQADTPDANIKKIETDFEMEYTPALHFEHSNSPVAPRIDGGYYISVTGKDKCLHVLSYDKDDKLIRDFNTNEKAYPFDITSTDYGFAIYMKEIGSRYHSYLSVYNKDFELINTVQIMNNTAKDDKTKNSTLNRQIIQYDSNRYPVYGMNFMNRPDNGKLIYSRGRIFLIFSHYNYFPKNGRNSGDTVVTFNDILTDMDFGVTWGSSHSLIQSATFDEYYFWTAALGDAYPQGINVEYTSKSEFSNDYDPIHKKYNSRISASDSSLAGSIKGYSKGLADGKLGGILYFAELKLYCLIYAKTPDEKSGKNIIYMTTWEFIDNKISNIKTTEIKRFDSNNVMQVRAGRYGNDKVFIIYSETTSSGGNGYGNVEKGTTPKLYVIKLPENKVIVEDKTYVNLLMNTNEDLRTFEDGVLIWATANKEGKLTINKIGETHCVESVENIGYKLNKEDLNLYLSTHYKIKEDIRNEENIEGKEKEEEKGNLSGGAIAGVVIGSVCGTALISAGIYFLLRNIKNIKTVPEHSTQAKSEVFKFSSSANSTTIKRGKEKKKVKN